MQQDTNTTFEITEGQQQYQAPLQPQPQQPVYTQPVNTQPMNVQPVNTYQPQQQYNQPPPYPQQNMMAQGAPYQMPTHPGQQELIVVNTANSSVPNSTVCSHSRFPVLITCPYCQKQGTTRIDFAVGTGTWICCFLLFLFCCCVCWVPFVSQGCRDVNHMCTSCGQIIGSCPYKVCG